MEVLGEDVLDIDLTVKDSRRALLPWWMKGFSWLFILISVIGVISLPFAAFGMSFNLSVYGFETNEPLSLIGLLIISLFILKGFTAYSLWYEKDWAITLGYLDGLVGILICVSVMWLAPYLTDDFESEFRVEIILLALFLWKLKKINPQWVNSHID